MENLPSYINVFFILTALLTVFIFYRAANQSKTVLVILCAWLVLQCLISITGFYTSITSAPPRFVLTIVPPLLLIALLFILPAGRRFIDSLNIKTLTILNIVRIPVEITLLWLFMHKAIPSVMTFEGRNFDILSGITAPVIYYFVFVKKWLGNKSLLVWNIVCLALLLNILVTAVLSAPFSFQQLGFDQPNVAILYFPFTWLPACIVPLVFFSHLASIRHLLYNKEVSNKPLVQDGMQQSFVK
ncbi:MAG: hypothetical protein ABIR15_14900 [Chitinophagaceae bacterium]